MGIGKAVLGAVDTVADKFFVDAKDKEAFKLKALELAQNGEFKAQEIQLSAILAEAKSADPWTSRARPSFLYVMYIMILFAIPMGILSAFRPEMAIQIANGMKAWLAAIPAELWTVFGFGYLGYVGAREYGKTKLIGK
ncbi:MAG: holin family protein [Nanoarchaeota archaeon]|nr:holin family protein [Nanoarchaeota archaeon]